MHTARRFLVYGSLGMMTVFAPLAAQQSQAEETAIKRKAYIERRIQDILEEKIYSRSHRDAGKNKKTPPSMFSSPEMKERDISKASEDESEIHAAINPKDTNNIVVCAITSRNGLALPVHYTKDFGKTWNISEPLPSSNAVGGGDPVFVYDADGKLYFSWIEIGQTSEGLEGGIYFSTSMNGGETWSAQDTITAFTLSMSAGGGLADKQWLAVDNTNSPYRNTLYAVFLDVDVAQNAANISVRKKLPDSDKFINKSIVASGDGFQNVQFSSIQVDSYGRVHVFFWGTKGSGYSLWHTVSSDGAERFSIAREISKVRFPDVNPNQTQVPAYLPQRFQVFPQFALDNHGDSPNAGNMYAVWCSNDLSSTAEGTFEEPFHIYFSVSTDGGTIWSSPARINTDNTSFRADHFHPSIEVSPRGDIVLSWYDGRSAQGGKGIHSYTAFSFDGGKTFSRELQVSTQASDITQQGAFGIGDYTKVIATSSYAIPLWADGRDGNMDIYAAFVPLVAEQVSGVEHRAIKSDLRILSVTPSPVQNRAGIRFSLVKDSPVQLEITDIKGNIVASPVSGGYEAGENTATIDCSAIAPGTYFFRLRSGSSTATQPFIINR